MAGRNRSRAPGAGQLAVVPAPPHPTHVTAAQSARDEWHVAAWSAVLEYAQQADTFTIYDVAQAKNIPAPAHPNHWGLLTSQMHREGLIQPVGWTQSHRPTSGLSGVRVWAAVHADGEAAA